MTRQCDSCREDYEAARASSRFCSPRCRVRASRSPAKTLDAPTTPPRDLSASGLVIATTTALEAAHALDSVLGQVAVEIAGRIVNPAETGAAVAALAKQLREVMVAALEGSEVVVVDPLDELRSRRDRKRRVDRA
jgi:hypothetical protein